MVSRLSVVGLGRSPKIFNSYLHECVSTLKPQQSFKIMFQSNPRVFSVSVWTCIRLSFFQIILLEEQNHAVQGRYSDGSIIFATGPWLHLKNICFGVRKVSRRTNAGGSPWNGVCNGHKSLTQFNATHLISGKKMSQSTFHGCGETSRVWSMPSCWCARACCGPSDHLGNL